MFVYDVVLVQLNNDQIWRCSQQGAHAVFQLGKPSFKKENLFISRLGFPCLNIFCFVFFFPVREVSFVKLKINWNRNCSQFSKLESRD